jgi:hypothetical protein
MKKKRGINSIGASVDRLGTGPWFFCAGQTCILLKNLIGYLEIEY